MHKPEWGTRDPYVTREECRKAMELIETKWTTGAFARDRNGVKVLACDPTADRFCAMGAVQHVRRDLSRVNYLVRLLNKAVRENHPNYIGVNIIQINDASYLGGQSQVLRMFRYVINMYLQPEIDHAEAEAAKYQFTIPDELMQQIAESRDRELV